MSLGVPLLLQDVTSVTVILVILNPELLRAIGLEETAIQLGVDW